MKSSVCIISFLVGDLNLQINNFVNNFIHNQNNISFTFYIFTDNIENCKNNNNINNNNNNNNNINNIFYFYYPHTLQPFYLFNQFQFIESLFHPDLAIGYDSIFLFNPVHIIRINRFKEVISDCKNKLILFNTDIDTSNIIPTFGGDTHKFISFIKTFTIILSKEKEKENYSINISNLINSLNKNYEINNNVIKRTRRDIYNLNFERIKYNQPMIIIKTSGGLGNNLFQVFCGLGLAYKFNRVPYIIYDKKYIEKMKKSGNTFRTSINKYYLTDLIGKVDSDQFDLNNTNKAIYQESEFNYNREIDDFFMENQHKHIIELNGYFQSTLYFKDYLNEIKNNNIFFKLKEEANTTIHTLKTSSITSLITSPITSPTEQNNKKYIGIHIRGGDYLNHKDFHLNLQASYYLNILNHHYDYNNLEEMKDTIFFIFTDDKKHASSLNLFSTEHKFFFVSDLIESNIIHTDYKNLDEFELFLFGQMDVMICANSSFALWASYLGDSPRVFIPNKWFVPNNPFVDISQLTLDSVRYNISNFC